jgi:hypothetical protein
MPAMLPPATGGRRMPATITLLPNDPDRLAAIALDALGPFHRNVARRFGLVPNFFMSAPDAPEIVEKFLDFATWQ